VGEEVNMVSRGDVEAGPRDVADEDLLVKVEREADLEERKTALKELLRRRSPMLAARVGQDGVRSSRPC
jgi:hypothetical protein